MPTYTITASFHVEYDNDTTLTDSENYSDMIDFFQSVVQGGSGVHFIKITEVEED